MKITEKEVRYVAELANLRLTEDEIARFQSELDGILAHIERLNEIDTTGVEPMAQVLFDGGLLNTEQTDTLRPDVVAPPLGSQLGLANAPQPCGGYFKVPRVIER